MKPVNHSLTPTEWNLMECLWEKSPRTGREATEYMEQSVGWSRSTTLTMLRRMTEKGIISCAEEDGVKVYAPCLRREDAVQQETENFLNRVYKGSVSMMMSAITQKQELTKEEIDELYAILRQAEEGRIDG
ncbi:MAG: BlaI/MecI/CopY family transcriptional regulator [Oscillospiraceae bacterium]